MEIADIQDFEWYVALAISALKTQDKLVTDSFKQRISTLVNSDYLIDILTTAMDCLAETDFETFDWAIHNYDPNFYGDIRQRIVVTAAQTLIQQGFIPGKDFSSLPVGGLIIREEAKAILMQDASALDVFMLQEILHCFNGTQTL